ncbi:MAG: protein kinase domain-containing protein, partial [Elusimicrobiales bacterium]
PNFADAMFLRALIYEKQSRYDDMLRDLEKASKLNPAYTSYFKDAVAAYSYRAPIFINYYDRNRDIFKDDTSKDHFDIKHFSVLLLLTLIGGALIGISLLHMLSPRITHSTTSSSAISITDTITPNIFYEGVASGKYRIVKKIGQGGMGTVYLAIDQSLNREVAIKKMNEDIKMNEREKQRFIEEARTVAMLHHPNIIEIYTIFEEKGDLYLVFEYIDGISLDEKLEDAVRMPFFEVKPIISEIAKALKYAHSRNVIHRDLKLSNVMISKDGFVKVTDFGLAKVIREAKARYSSNEVVGSPAYMAPEQDNGIFVKESDLYSLGVCIYELLVGELPFSGPDYHYQKERKLYTPLSHIVAGVPKDIDRIVSKLLEPDPQYRYRTADEFLKDFENLS